MSILLLLGAIVSYLLGWSSEEETSEQIELVLHDGAAIIASGAGKSIRVTSQSHLKKTYEWDDCKLKTTMIERASRWFGSRGAYDPGGSFGISFGCNGISRTVVQEGQFHFDDTDFALEWIRRRPSIFTTVISSEGLLVSWGLSPHRSQLSVNVWLMCLNGKPFRQEIDSKVSRIKVIPNSQGQTIRACQSVHPSEIDQTKKQIEEFWAEVDSWNRINLRN